MSYFPALRGLLLLLLLVLPLSFGWKLAVQRGGSDEFEEAKTYLKISEFLTRQSFIVTVSKKMEEGQPSILATAGSCRILVAKSGSEGVDRERIRLHATAADTVFAVFGGRIYPEQPKWQQALDGLWSKFRRELGFNAHATPVFVVIATKTCGAEQLPWHQLG